MLAIGSLIPLPFLNRAWTSESWWFMYCWRLDWRNLRITLLRCEMSTIVWYLNILWHCPSLGLEWKLTFSSPMATAQFSKFASTLSWSALTASSFRIWNSSAGIPSPPVALFVVMVTKAHLTSHSRMSNSRWVTTPSWLSGSLRPFLHSSVYFATSYLICFY